MDGPTGKAQVSIRLPMNLLDQCDRIATATERDRTWVILRALKQYVEGEGADVLKEADGLALLNQGDGVDFETVQAEAVSIIAHAREKHGHSG